MKICKNCGELKPILEFHKNKNRPDGLAYYCKVCVSTYGKERYGDKKPDILNQHRKYRKENRDKVLLINRESNKKYHQNNKHLRIALTAKRRAKKLQATPPWLTKEHLQEMREFYKMAKELEDIFPWKQQVDHIVPLQGESVSGLHVPWNLQIVPEHRNKSKGNRLVEETGAF